MGCEMDDRWQSELIWSVCMLDNAVAELEKMGFLLSHMGVHLHLIPR